MLKLIYPSIQKIQQYKNNNIANFVYYGKTRLCNQIPLQSRKTVYRKAWNGKGKIFILFFIVLHFLEFSNWIMAIPQSIPVFILYYLIVSVSFVEGRKEIDFLFFFVVLEPSNWIMAILPFILMFILLFNNFYLLCRNQIGSLLRSG